MEYGIDFNIGDRVTFGVRFDGHGRIRGGIARKTASVVNYAEYTGKPSLITVESEGSQYELRELKGGWVVKQERDDPKGRLYMKKV